MSRILENKAMTVEAILSEAARCFDDMGEGAGATSLQDGELVRSVLGLLDKGDVETAVRMLVDRPEMVKDEVSDEELDGVQNLLVRAAMSLPEDSRDGMLRHMLSTWYADAAVASNVDLRLQLLANLFSLCAGCGSAVRGEALLRWTDAAMAHGMATAVAAQVAHAGKWLEECALNVEQKKRLVLSMADALASQRRLAEEVAWLLRYTRLADISNAADAKLIARTAMAVAKLPAGAVAVTEEEEAVLATGAKAEHALLTIVRGGTVAELDAHHATHPAVYETHGVDVDMIRRRLRLGGLAAAAASGVGVPYAEMAAAFGVAEDAVEDTVLAAIGEGSLDARMDPLDRVVFIRNVPNGVMALDHWARFANVLSAWTAAADAALKASSPAATH